VPSADDVVATATAPTRTAAETAASLESTAVRREGSLRMAPDHHRRGPARRSSRRNGPFGQTSPISLRAERLGNNEAAPP